MFKATFPTVHSVSFVIFPEVFTTSNYRGGTLSFKMTLHTQSSARAVVKTTLYLFGTRVSKQDLYRIFSV